MCSPDIFLGVLAILFPPLPVWVKCGICSTESLLNFLLFLLGYIPGLLHAWYIIAKYPESFEYEPLDHEQGRRVTYVVISDSPRPSPPPQRHPQQHNISYGTTSQGGSEAQAGSSQACPPSYAEVVSGDHKIQNA
ncbi:related to SNA2 Integral mebrane protein [Cephalotrichum gorgonifer]|uniref:Related to SNA2 Integral mebrane protein n=1 Tax=Cephalotrichum gorgonifer TaxID=2041049 RepID=A0AAE8MSL2_9PEZI|nr:related to SNA2 Integral mebrane protein [Cephalotrichum gorgonifer]